MTPEQKEILAHIVADPDAWYSHVLKTFGEEKAKEALIAKVKRWKPEYEKRKAQFGRDYKCRKDRDEIEHLEQLKQDQQRKIEVMEAEEKRKAELKSLVSEEVKRLLGRI